MVSAPPSSGSTDKPLPRMLLRIGGKEGEGNVVSEKNNNKPVGSKKKKRWSSTHSRSCALEDMSKRDRPQRPGREVCFDQKMFSCKKCYKSFQTESVLRRWEALFVCLYYVQGGFFDWSALEMTKYEEKLKYLN